MELYIIGLIVFLLAVIVSRFILDKANLQLQQDKKARLVDISSAGRLVNMVVLVAIIGLFLLNMQFKWTDPLTSLVIYAILLALFAVWRNVGVYRKLKNNDFPQEYIQTYILVAVIRIISLALLVGSLGLQMKNV